MAYQSLYRTYRPQSFDEVIGQQHIVQTLKNAIARNQLAHAYLFTGPRGTGKTTIAKLLAKGMNCLNPSEAPCNHCEMCLSMNQENHPDIFEIDAASNTGVDDVRDLIERVKYAPIEARKKVYIIDEVHMLSTGAFNALLKTLEEPPSHVVFILATTEVHKVLPTIISRCQRYDFTRVSARDIETNLSTIIEKEKLEVEPGVIEQIAYLADGGHRDALTILEQLIAYSHHPITLDDLYELYRLSTPQNKFELIEALSDGDLLKALDNIKQLETKSVDYNRYIFDFVALCKEALVYQLSKDRELISHVNFPVVDKIVKLNQEQLVTDIANKLIEIAQEARFNGQYQAYLEMAAVNLTREASPVIEEEIIEEKEPIKEVKEEIVFEPTVEENTILNLMVLGDRSQRSIDTEKWNKKDLYLSQLKYRRLSQLLTNSQVGVSADNFLVIVNASDVAVQSLMEESYHELLYELLGDLDLKKKVFVVDINQFNSTKEQFIEKMNNNQLPDRESIDMDFSLPFNEEEQKKKVDPKELLQATFKNLRIED